MPLRKKGRGQCFMVSEFLSEVQGRLTHAHVCEDGTLEEAREIIHPGKNKDGYWTGVDAKQYKKAIAIHKKNFPDYDALWAYNSSNHGCFAEDALLVSIMNLGPGGKQALMRDGFFNGQIQKMVFPEDYPEENMRGKEKGMKQVLVERGLWREDLLKICEDCRSKLRTLASIAVHRGFWSYKLTFRPKNLFWKNRRG